MADSACQHMCNNLMSEVIAGYKVPDGGETANCKNNG